jgi:hypothetical protein
MIRIAKKPDLRNTIAVKVWTQAGISSSLGPANLAFCINLQENRLGKEKSRKFKLNLVKLLASKG